MERWTVYMSGRFEASHYSEWDSHDPLDGVMFVNGHWDRGYYSHAGVLGDVEMKLAIL